jgi:hypothetical protein
LVGKKYWTERLFLIRLKGPNGVKITIGIEGASGAFIAN